MSNNYKIFSHYDSFNGIVGKNFQIKIEDLKKMKEQLNSLGNQTLKQYLTTLSAQIDYMGAELEKLRKQINENDGVVSDDSSINSIKHELLILTEELTLLKHTDEQCRTDLTTLTNDFNTHKKYITEENEDLQNKYADLNVRLDVTTNKNDVNTTLINDVVNDFTSFKSDYETDLEESQTRFSNIQTKVENNKEKVNGVINDFMSFQQQNLTDLEVIRDELREDYQDLFTRIDTTDKNLTLMIQERDESNSEIHNLLSDQIVQANENLNRAQDDFSNQISEFKNMIEENINNIQESLINQITTLEDTIGESVTHISIINDDISNLQSRTDEIENLLIAMQEQILTLEGKVETLEGMIRNIPSS